MTVREFLTQHDLAAYADAFEAQRVELADLSAMTDDELKGEFGITVFGDRKRFKAAVAGLSSAPAPSLSGPTHVAPTPTPTPSLSGPTRMYATAALPERLGNYRILGLVGSGGMGTVVRARHTEEGWARQQGGDVAIKLIHPHIATDAAFRSRFMSEAAMGRKVQHRGFVTTWDVLSEGAWLGTVMSLVAGEPLTNKVVPGGLPVADVVRLLTPIAEALDYLHGLGIVHRDLKPANIVVRPDGQPVVLDLGIAKDSAALENHTRTMTAMGTSAWMAPEQAADAKNVDGAADRYALGMIAYALLSGRLPWEEGTSEVGVLVSKMTGKLVPLAQVRAGLPSHVVAAVMKMVSVDAGGRYATGVGFVAALKADEGAARAAAEAKVKADAAAKRDEEARAQEAAKRAAAEAQKAAKRAAAEARAQETTKVQTISQTRFTAAKSEATLTTRDFLTRNDLASFIDVFEAQNISIAALADIGDVDLSSDFGMVRFIDRKRFRTGVARLGGAAVPSTLREADAKAKGAEDEAEAAAARMKRDARSAGTALRRLTDAQIGRLRAAATEQTNTRLRLAPNLKPAQLINACGSYAGDVSGGDVVAQYDATFFGKADAGFLLWRDRIICANNDLIRVVPFVVPFSALTSIVWRNEGTNSSLDFQVNGQGMSLAVGIAGPASWIQVLVEIISEAIAPAG